MFTGSWREIDCFHLSIISIMFPQKGIKLHLTSITENLRVLNTAYMTLNK